MAARAAGAKVEQGTSLRIIEVRSSFRKTAAEVQATL